jgi:hypothetical protein
MRPVALPLTVLIAGLMAGISGWAQAAGSGNPTQDRLLSLPPAAQADALARNVGRGCVGMSAFPMGLVNTDKWKSLAYWSVKCKNGSSYAVQIAPNAETFVIDCRLLQANGRECFKKF